MERMCNGHCPLTLDRKVCGNLSASPKEHQSFLPLKNFKLYHELKMVTGFYD